MKKNNPDHPISRPSSTNNGVPGHSPLESEVDPKEFLDSLVFNESKRFVPPPILVPDTKVNSESVESVVFKPHVNPLMFTLDFGIKGGKPEK
jgi:hypothetical protein